MFGVDEDHLHRDGWLPYVHPENRASVAATVDHNRRHGTAFRCRVRVVRPDGAVRWAALRGSTVDGDALLLVVDDVTSAIEAEQSLARRAQEYRQLVELSDGIVVRIAPDATILYASPSCEALLGWRSTEIVGRSALAFVHVEVTRARP